MFFIFLKKLFLNYHKKKSIKHTYIFNFQNIK